LFTINYVFAIANTLALGLCINYDNYLFLFFNFFFSI
jgi:hypothetical protein